MKEHNGAFWNVGKLDLDLGVGYMGVYVCKNSLSGIL